MKLVILSVICLAVVANAQGGWGPWASCSNGVQTRTCLNTTLGCQPPSQVSCGCGNWGACSMPCDGATRNGYQTRTCTNNNVASTQQQVCNTQACKNCTVSQWSYPSPCSRQCGTGWSHMQRQVLQQPDIAGGGTPCPILQLSFQCNTHFCQENINGWGYLSWGPIYGGAPGQPITITYKVYSDPDNVDVFLFAGDDNYLLYIQDSQRTKAWNTGYTAYASMLNTNNCYQTVTLQAGVNYYLVVDNTPVGAANGNNGNYQQETIGYNVTGFDLTTIPPPLNTADAAHITSSLLAIFAAFSALLAAFFRL